MYLGGSILTFALPYGAFIVIATALFFLFRAKHHVPKLNYMPTEEVASVGTLEPGPVPAPSPKATAAPATAAPEDAKAEAKAEGEAIDAETEGKEGAE
jgi:ribosomal protein L12E/L44/L45/RPP1/RPP2